MALEQESARRPDLPQPVRDRDVSLVLTDEWLILSSNEVVIGGRGSDLAGLRISAPLPKRHALLLRDRKGYALQPLLLDDRTHAGVEVNGQEVLGTRRLKHGHEVC